MKEHCRDYELDFDWNIRKNSQGASTPYATKANTSLFLNNNNISKFTPNNISNLNVVNEDKDVSIFKNEIE